MYSYLLSSSTFPSKSHVLSINRDEVTLFQVRAIRYDLRIFGLRSLDTSFVRPLCALWGAGRARPALATHSRTTLLPTTIKRTLPSSPNYILMVQHQHSRGGPCSLASNHFKYKIKNLISVAKPINEEWAFDKFMEA